jgi:hypothetical protein
VIILGVGSTAPVHELDDREVQSRTPKRDEMRDAYSGETEFALREALALPLRPAVGVSSRPERCQHSFLFSAHAVARSWDRSTSHSRSGALLVPGLPRNSSANVREGAEWPSVGVSARSESIDHLKKETDGIPV